MLYAVCTMMPALNHAEAEPGDSCRTETMTVTSSVTHLCNMTCVKIEVKMKMRNWKVKISPEVIMMISPQVDDLPCVNEVPVVVEHANDVHDPNDVREVRHHDTQEYSPLMSTMKPPLSN